MTETRAYNRAELDLLPTSVVMDAMRTRTRNETELADLVCGISGDFDRLTMPIRLYAVAVVERFESLLCGYEKGPTLFINWIENEGGRNITFLHRANFCESHFLCPTNPFQGLTNPDGTQVTSVTREVLDAWKRGEVV